MEEAEIAMPKPVKEYNVSSQVLAEFERKYKEALKTIDELTNLNKNLQHKLNLFLETHRLEYPEACEGDEAERWSKE